MALDHGVERSSPLVENVKELRDNLIRFAREKAALGEEGKRDIRRAYLEFSEETSHSESYGPESSEILEISCIHLTTQYALGLIKKDEVLRELGEIAAVQTDSQEVQYVVNKTVGLIEDIERGGFEVVV